MAVEEITGMYDLLDALEEALKAADPAKRKLLQKPLMLMPRIFRKTFIGLSGRSRRHSYIICSCR
jgi:hypothetical protein